MLKVKFLPHMQAISFWASERGYEDLRIDPSGQERARDLPNFDPDYRFVCWYVFQAVQYRAELLVGYDLVERAGNSVIELRVKDLFAQTKLGPAT